MCHTCHHDRDIFPRFQRAQLFLCVCPSDPANSLCLWGLSQKLTSDLTGVEQQKKVLEMELEQWRQSTFPHPPAAPVNAGGSCQGRTMPTPAPPVSPVLEAEVKQLQAKLKVSGYEFRAESSCGVSEWPSYVSLACTHHQTHICSVLNVHFHFFPP